MTSETSRREHHGGWTTARIIACAAGSLLGLVSAGLLAGGIYITCADIRHWNTGSSMMSWLGGELLAAGVFIAAPAIAMVLIALRQAEDDR